MFGENPIRKQDLSSPNQLWIQEVFPTIQGEGPFAGEGAIFVRLGGCNLKCFWCDTDFESSTWHPHMDELLLAIIAANEHIKTDLVVLTGGEPFRQDISVLCFKLLEQGHRVQIETNGIRWIDAFNDDWARLAFANGNLSIVCSPKTAKINKTIESLSSCYKYIVSFDDTDKEDGLPILSTQTKQKHIRLARPPNGKAVYVQPLDSYDKDENRQNELHAISLVKQYGYRMSYQLHKHLGLP